MKRILFTLLLASCSLNVQSHFHWGGIFDASGTGPATAKIMSYSLVSVTEDFGALIGSGSPAVIRTLLVSPNVTVDGEPLSTPEGYRHCGTTGFCNTDITNEGALYVGAASGTVICLVSQDDFFTNDPTDFGPGTSGFATTGFSGDAGGHNFTVNRCVTVQVAAPPVPTPLATPQTCTSEGEKDYFLSWSHSSGASTYSVRVRNQVNGSYGAWTFHAQTNEPTHSLTMQVPSNVETQQAQVTACTSTLACSAWSSAVQVTNDCVEIDPPPMPTSVAGSFLNCSGAYSVWLTTWVGSSEASLYNVFSHYGQNFLATVATEYVYVYVNNLSTGVVVSACNTAGCSAKGGTAYVHDDFCSS